MIFQGRGPCLAGPAGECCIMMIFLYNINTVTAVVYRRTSVESSKAARHSGTPNLGTPALDYHQVVGVQYFRGRSGINPSDFTHLKFSIKYKISILFFIVLIGNRQKNVKNVLFWFEILYTTYIYILRVQ